MIQTIRQKTGQADRRHLDFGLFFFSSDGSTDQPRKYQLLLDCARFADRAGFAAVWLPERHFQVFGGLYPNPSVLGAAIAMITSRIHIRAGSVVLPLHNPLRVAEEWAVVDNLSGGRVAISFASGWHKRDFAMSPAAFADRRTLMEAQIGTVLRLWSGNSVTLPGGDGDPVEVRTYPVPLQKKLTFWLTGRSDETWDRAARLGANVLCLMRASVNELSDGIGRYRSARAGYGHDPNTGKVTVMMHTYLGNDLAAVKEAVRAPMKKYLEDYISQFPADPTKPAAPSMDREQLLDFAFERYFQGGSLLGTTTKCTTILDQLVVAGVDEVACLLDFGLSSEAVLSALPLLNELRGYYSVSPVTA
jgi:natural product biosynthesis luciferase-like monooxygenase protein